MQQKCYIQPNFSKLPKWKGNETEKKVRELESDVKKTLEKKSCNSYDYLVTGLRFAWFCLKS